MVKPKKAERDWLTSGEMATHCMVSRDTIKRWIREGILDSVSTPGGRNRIPRHVAVRFLRDHNIPVPESLSGESAYRALVVDDNRTVRETMKRIFDHAGGQFELEIASGGVEGCVKIGLFKPHILILDLLMPEVDGFKVIEAVRGNPETKDTKILAYSGYLTPARVDRALRAGADDYLSKPFQPDAFWSKVSELLGLGEGVVRKPPSTEENAPSPDEGSTMVS
jgi:excisionase family DNA binding protein